MNEKGTNFYGGRDASALGRRLAGIPIVQAVRGTDQIGRFDIMVDTDRNAIDSFTWQLMHSFHYMNMGDFLDISAEEAKRYKPPRVVSSQTQSVLDEWLSQQEYVAAPQDHRWVTLP